MKRLILFITLFFNYLFSTEYINNYTDFYKVNPDDYTNIIGEISTIGNTVQAVTKCKRITNLYQINTCEIASENNKKYFDNKYMTKFIKADHSSIAYLKLPPNATKIVWAAVVWQGHVNNYTYQKSNTSVKTRDGHDYYYWDWEYVKLNGKYYKLFHYWRSKYGYYYQLSNDLPGNKNEGIKDTNANKIVLEINNTVYNVEADKLFYKGDSRHFCNRSNGKRCGYDLSQYKVRRGVKYSAYKILTDEMINTLNENLNLAKKDGLPIKISELTSTWGLEARLGDYGAWSLVVIYKTDPNDNNSKLNNIDVYLGFKSLPRGDTHDMNINISGLILPKKGEIKSTLSIFTAEGEEALSGDYVKVNGIKMTEEGADENNIFDSKLSDDIQRDPKLNNNDGIDIDIFDASDAMEKIRDDDPDATSYTAKIKVHSYPDGIFIGLITFQTQLYKPRVCYYIEKITDENNNTIFENGKFVEGAEINPEDTYNITFWISNMKKSSNDEDIEDAEKVKVFMFTKNFQYINNSTYMKNIGQQTYYHQTDEEGDDLFSYFVDNNESRYNVGEGADAQLGGLIEVATFNDDSKKAYVKYKGKFIVDQNTTTIDLVDIFTFKASFKTKTIEIEENNAQLIEQCRPLNTRANVYVPELGNFNVVNKDFIGNIDPVDVNSSLNALYTQIINKPFEVKVLHLDNDNETLTPVKTVVKLELINDPQNEDECQNFNSLKTKYVVFDNTAMVDTNFTYDKSLRFSRFRVEYFINSHGGLLEIPDSCLGLFESSISGDWDANDYYNNSINCAIAMGVKTMELTQCIGSCVLNEPVNPMCYIECIFGGYETKKVCSRDNFSIRPYKFEIDNIQPVYKAGEEYNLTIKAVDYNGNTAIDYDENLSLNMTSPHIEYNETKLNCKTGNLNPDLNTLNFVDGIANVTFSYDEVGELNITVKELNGSEYAVIDNDDTAWNDRKIEEANVTLRFLPYEFNVTASYINFKDGNFTYVSNDLNMSSVLNINISAVAKGGTSVTRNYNKECYAQDFNITVTHSVPTDHLIEKIIYKEQNTTEQNITKTDNIVLNSLSKEYFSTDHNGSAILNILINFPKDYATPVNEFNFTIHNISVIDKNLTTGSSGDINDTATFRYGSIFVNNVSGYDTKELYFAPKYMYYKNDTWELNENHNDSDFGDINVSNAKSYYPSDINLSIVENIHQGKEKIKISTTHALPYSAKIHLAIDNWMWYHPLALNYQDPKDINSTNLNCLTHPCVKATFLKSGKGWAGVGKENVKYHESNVTVESNITKETNVSKQGVKKLNW